MHSGEESICNECWPKGVGQLSCSRGGRGGGVWWEGEVCRSGEGMWESAGNGGMCDVSSCTTLIVCHNSPLLRSRCLYIYLQLTLNMIQQATLCVHTRISVLIFTSAAMSTIFQSVQRAQRRKTATLQVRLRVLWCVEAGIVECLKEWRCMVGRDGGV